MMKSLGIPVWSVAVGVNLLDGGAGGIIHSDIVECCDVELKILGEFGDVMMHDQCTLESCGPVIPTQSVRPRRYLPIFSPPQFPDRPQKATTSACSTYFPSFTSIQCAMTPMKAAFVISVVHPSEVTETFPGATWRYLVFTATSKNPNTYYDVHLQLTKPLLHFAVKVDTDIVGTRHIGACHFWSHCHQDISERNVVGNGKCLVSDQHSTPMSGTEPNLVVASYKLCDCIK